MTRRRAILVALEIGTPVVLVAIWWFASYNSLSIFFPPLRYIAESFAENWFGERFVSDVVPSVARMLAGYLVAIVAGVGLGLVIGQWRIARKLTGPAVSFLRSIPGAALLPPAVTLLGVGSGMKVAIIAFICLWPILLNTIDGLDEQHPTAESTAKVFRIGGWNELLWVTVPGALPRIFAGLRTSLALAVIMLVISEMVASTNGLGFFTLQAQRTFDVPDMWAGIIMIGLLGYVLTLIFTVIERAVLRWYLESRSAS
jgi:ABC-type nitrate/sulfonate/bicarbonate transport system permease component